MTWAAGEVIVLREVLGGRIRSARPLRVMEDGPDGVAGFLAPRSQVAWPRLVGDAQSQTPDQGWRLAREEWQGPGCLFVLPAGEAFAAVSFLEPGSGRPLGWKVDFLAPPQRHAVGLDTLDWAVDLLVAVDLSSWSVKDEDDLAQLELVGLLDEDGGARVRAARRRVEARLAARSAPFTGGWSAWRPPADGVAPLALPEGWDRLEPRSRPMEPGPARSPAGPPPASVAPRRGSGRSASGTRLLDESGRVLLDLDLAGGTLLHGHAHPRIVEAVTRQAPLGLGASSGHGLEATLGERLAARFPPADAVAWTASGEEAWWRAVRTARRATGRRNVACWTPAPALGGDDHDADLVVLPRDAGRAERRLRDRADRWAAVVVDPLVLATMTGAAGVLALLRDRWPAPGALLVADERRTLGAGPNGGHGRLGLAVDLVVAGPSLFAGLGGGALAGPRELVEEAVDDVGGLPGTDGPVASIGAVHPLLVAAGLATLQLATPGALDELDRRADRLRSRCGLLGLGGAVRLAGEATPERLAARGLLVDGSGWAWLATVTSDDDVEEAAAVLGTLG